MKKFAKMSLAAAVAVAGLTSTASAVDLTEAIKGVDVSGQFRYRFQERKLTGSNNQTNSDVEVEVTAKVPVNDMVSAIFKIDNAGNHDDTQPTMANGSAGKGDVEIEDYYFQYVNGAITVNAGQQNIPGRMTDGAQGDGLVALYNAGAFTVGAAAFANHSVNVTPIIAYDGSQSLLSIIAMGSVGPVSLLGQYATVEDTLDAYNLKADAKIGPVAVGLEYTESEIDAKTGLPSNVRDDRSTFMAYVSGKIDIVSAKLTYAATGDNGSGSIDSQLSNQGLEAVSEFLLWNIGTSNKADMSVWALDVSAKVTDKVSLRVAYADGEQGNAVGNDINEILGQVSYKMSKNLNTYVRYSEFDSSATGDNKGQRGRVEVRYTF